MCTVSAVLWTDPRGLELGYSELTTWVPLPGQGSPVQTPVGVEARHRMWAAGS